MHEIIIAKRQEILAFAQSIGITEIYIARRKHDVTVDSLAAIINVINSSDPNASSEYINHILSQFSMYINNLFQLPPHTIRIYLKKNVDEYLQLDLDASSCLEYKLLRETSIPLAAVQNKDIFLQFQERITAMATPLATAMQATPSQSLSSRMLSGEQGSARGKKTKHRRADLGDPQLTDREDREKAKMRIEPNNTAQPQDRPLETSSSRGMQSTGESYTHLLTHLAHPTSPPAFSKPTSLNHPMPNLAALSHLTPSSTPSVLATEYSASSSANHSTIPPAAVSHPLSFLSHTPPIFAASRSVSCADSHVSYTPAAAVNSYSRPCYSADRPSLPQNNPQIEPADQMFRFTIKPLNLKPMLLALQNTKNGESWKTLLNNNGTILFQLENYLNRLFDIKDVPSANQNYSPPIDTVSYQKEIQEIVSILQRFPEAWQQTKTNPKNFIATLKEELSTARYVFQINERFTQMSLGK